MPAEGFDAIMVKRPIKALRANRNAIISLFEEIEKTVSTLPIDQASVVELNRETAHAETQIEEFRSNNKSFVQSVLAEDESLNESEGYKLDQEKFWEAIKGVETVIKTCKEILIDAEVEFAEVKAEAVVNGDLAALIQQNAIVLVSTPYITPA